MFRPRVIPVLLLKGQSLVKTISFKNERYIGDPINAVKIFNDLEADELVFLDILATKERRTVSLQFVQDVGAEANMPFAVGGGIRTLEDVRKIISAGAEKVVINSFAVEFPEFIQQASRNFGSSTITVCMDVKNALFKGPRIWKFSGNRSSRYSPIDFARIMEDKGAGELILQSITNDGQMQGYDIPLIKEISEAVSIPVVALGGAGTLEHFKHAYTEGFASAVGAGSFFVYQGSKRGVLINYPQRSEIINCFQ
ncbi:MAG: AglZ/HisF2 family acetamidino modification protein [Candidatus Electrothrix scaldis]|nr:MAG: AglZ/HisF2 family acetamidino modification protein [Candidatus Electrothrix sp. GW3-3]